MNIEWIIARRLIFNRTAEHRSLRPIMRLSTASVALGIAVMIIAVSVLAGFKQQITEKVTGFLSHVQITNYDGNNSYETNPIGKNPAFLPQLAAMPNVAHIQPFALKTGIIVTPDNFQGVVLKGIDRHFDWSFFDANMTEGAHFTPNDTASINAVCISYSLANLLQLKVGETIDMYFVQEPPRQRRFKIEGIFDTKLRDFDKLFVLCDIRHTQRLNGWNSEQVTGYEIYLSDFSRLDETFTNIKQSVFYTASSDSARFMAETVKQRYAQIFSWLQLLDVNVAIILALMLLVAGFNMISSMLIMLLEHTPLIGMLKAMGAAKTSLQRIFMYQSLFIIARGLLWGNVTGVGFCILQKYFSIVPLNPDTYYLSQVPVSISAPYIALINAGAVVIIMLMLVVPSLWVGSVSPSRVLRFR